MAYSQRTSSPVLTLPPGAAHPPSFAGPGLPHQPSPLSCAESLGTSWCQPTIVQRPACGRKRSRDEAAVNLDVSEAKLQTIEPIKESEDDWVYGEGMTLIKPRSVYVADAGSQSGTWVEEKAAVDDARPAEDAIAIQQQARPSLRSNKSQRLDMNHDDDDNGNDDDDDRSVPGPRSQGNRTSPHQEASLPDSTPRLPPDTNSQPIVDNFTLHLGVGWSRISHDEHIQAAARGWARYIENHYPVRNVQIQLESRGLQSYLIEASEGYFLFAEDLRHGQLVSRDVGRTFANLKASPPVFDGLEVMSAAETPRPVDAVPDATTLRQATTGPVDVEMDVS